MRAALSVTRNATKAGGLMQNIKRLGDLALSDTGFAFDPYSGSTFTMNATGLSVVQAMKEGLALDAVVERLRERFEVQSADVRRDVEDFTALLRQHGLVTDEEG
jgi:PqqD family protein of HPr-rel-A system